MHFNTAKQRINVYTQKYPTLVPKNNEQIFFYNQECFYSVI